MKKISLLLAPLAAVTLLASYGCSKVDYKVTEEEFNKALKMECEYVQFDGSISMSIFTIAIDTKMNGELSPTVSHIVTNTSGEGKTDYNDMFIQKKNETYSGIVRKSKEAEYTSMDSTLAATYFTTPNMLPSMFYFPTLSYSEYTYDEKSCLYTGVMKGQEGPIPTPDTAISLKFKNKQLSEIHTATGEIDTIDATFAYNKKTPSIPWPKQ